MGVARQHGDVRAFTRGHTRHQEDAHKILTAEGFAFERQTGGTKNVYKHEDGRRITVSATPRNPSVDLAYIKTAIHSPRQEGQAGTRRETEVATTKPQSPTTPLVAMADAFLLKEQTTKHGKSARNAALAKWVERVLAKHGPLTVRLLDEAAAELGFPRHNVVKARSEIGAAAWRAGGAKAGWIVGLESQIPDDVTVYGRESAPKNGVAVEVGENNGSGPEPREEPAEEFPTPEQAQAEIAAAFGPELPGEQLKTPTAPLPTFREDGGEVSAAAQLLLSSLGLKTAHPRMGEGLDSLDEFLADLEWRVNQARVQVATLKTLLS